jgi:precorrin-6A/cobalt-precorrin-6A reductase
VRRVLILGGTTEANALARRLDPRADLEVTTSFAGRTTSPRAAAGLTRVGGFGGSDGLAAHLTDSGVDLLVDGTHPFAARMRWHAQVAADRTGVPRLRLERPPWAPVAGDTWRRVTDLDAAAAAVRSHERVFLTTGRTELAPFLVCDRTWFLIRSVEPPDPQPLPDAEVVLDRGPFTVDDERALLVTHAIDAVVTKNSGGDAAAAKLTAARDLGLPVVVVDRPPNTDGPLVDTVDAAESWVLDQLDQAG